MASRIGSWTVIQSSADPMSQSISVDAAAELFVLCVGLYDTGAPAPTAVTLGGNALTLATRVTVDVAEQTGIWYLANPPTGTQTLEFNHAGTIDEGAHFFWSVWEDVDTAGTPVDSLGSTQNGANNQTIVTPTAGTANTGDVAVGVGCVFGSDGIALTGEVVDDTVFNGNDAAVGEIAGSGASVSFTVTSGDFPAVSGIIIRNAVGGGGTVNTETLEDTITVADATVSGALRNRLLDSLLSITEGGLISSTVFMMIVDDLLSVADTGAQHAIRGRVAQSEINVTDEALASIIGQTILTRVLESTISVADGVIASMIRGRIAQDTIIVSEPSLETFITTNMLATDDLEITDQTIARLLFRRLLGDDVGVSDDYIASVIGQNVISRVLTSEFTTVDQALFWMERHRLGQSNVLTADETQRVINYTRELLSLIDAADSAQSALQRFILLTDALSLDDSVTATYVPDPGNVIYNKVIRIGFDQPRIDVGGYGI